MLHLEVAWLAKDCIGRNHWQVRIWMLVMLRKDFGPVRDNIQVLGKISANGEQHHPPQLVLFSFQLWSVQEQYVGREQS